MATPVGPASTLSTGNPSAPALPAATAPAAPTARNTATRPAMTSSPRHGPPAAGDAREGRRGPLPGEQALDRRVAATSLATHLLPGAFGRILVRAEAEKAC